MLPELVIERIAVHADTTSLVSLAACSRQLWHAIRALQSLWHQHYQACYPPDKDDNEAAWLVWYIKTLRVAEPSPSAPCAMKHGHSYPIQWFHVFCRRRATDANWFRNDPRQLQTIQEADRPRQRRARVAVLQRVLVKDAVLGRCRVVEQCQPMGGSTAKRYWRWCTPCRTGIDPALSVKQCFLTDKYLLLFTDRPEGSSDDYRLPGRLLVWPVDRIAAVPPRCLAHDYSGSVDVRGDWVLFRHVIRTPSKTDEVLAVTIHTLHLTTGQLSTTAFDDAVTWAFLQRTTDTTATLLRVSFAGFHTGVPVQWSIWQLAAHRPENTPRCLAKGSFVVSGYNDLTPRMERLDDHRMLVRCATYRHSAPSMGQHDADTLTLAVIPAHSPGDGPVAHQPPIWSRSILMISARPLVALDRVVVMTDEGCTVYGLSNGDAIAFTRMDAIQSLLLQHCRPQARDHLRMDTSYVQAYILCEALDDRSYIAVDLLHPEQTGRRRMAYVFEHYRVKASEAMFVENLWNRQYYAKLLRMARPNGRILTLIICTVDVLLVHHNDDYKLLDFSL
ncbi:hypothetical protein SYNPS1DRAFT_29801 [Syncephalis pseudoplumigaleata]|uniref:F-box domain-containing protein n=1 Tax=Syncephalis pseudoplumigaleata TaxID=1712513 RepID=A0A4V1J1B1_9FUNG|nr:hypothetical protein SYNPS1DRAFT_29801 [Syncephalis pseudoplumigaleata]|eukprot:RKP24439.1 hypothetical protein SYNPS1DRAFT_29801 [Syncephalis pseudoplumigaleata]